MRMLLTYLTVFSLLLPNPALATKPTAVEPVVPPAFLAWDQFVELSQEDRTLYFLYLNLVGAVLQEAKYPGEQIWFGDDLMASSDLEEPSDFWKWVFASNEAHAAAPIFVAVGFGARVCIRYCANVASRMWGAAKNFFSRGASRAAPKSGEIIPPGGSVPGGLKNVNPSNLPAVRTGTTQPRIPGRDVGQAKPPGGGQQGPIPLKATDVPTAPAPAAGSGFMKGVAAGSTGTMIGTEGLKCAMGEGLCTKEPTTGPTAGPDPVTLPAEEEPKFERVKGATCIFGSYGTSYSVGGDGGCKPPKNTINSKECSGVKKPTFFCNEFGLTKGNKKAAKAMCIQVKKGMDMAELTEKCANNLKSLMDNNSTLLLDKAKYEELVEKLNKMLGDKAPGQLSLKEYCGRDYDNKANEKRQARECIALRDMLKAIEEKIGKHGGAAAPAAPAAAPGGPLKLEPVGTPATQ